MQNRFSELLAIFESEVSNQGITLSGKRRDLVIEALQIAAKAEDAKPYGVLLAISVSYKRLADLMTTFFESGDPVTREWLHRAVRPAIAGRGTLPWYARPELYADPAMSFRVEVEKPSAADPGVRYLKLADLVRGLALLAVAKGGAYAHHFQDFLADNEDAGTADIFMQMVVYGEEVFS